MYIVKMYYSGRNAGFYWTNSALAASSTITTSTITITITAELYYTSVYIIQFQLHALGRVREE